MFWQLMVSYTHLLLLLKTPVMWLSIVAFNNAAKPKWILREFDVSRTQARLDGLPHLHMDCYMAKFEPCWEGYQVW